MTEGEISYLVQELGCRILRIPLNQEWVLGRPDYLDQLRQVIAWIGECGAYALLDLQWLDDRTPRGQGNRVPALPVPESLAMWRVLGQMFRGAPCVLFDLFNEPHNPLPDDPEPLLRPDGSRFPEQRCVTFAMWREWAVALIDSLREVHPDSVVFVSGLDWGYDLRGFPLERGNVVYSTHVYRARGTNWHEAFGALAATHCVFAGEWGGVARDLNWGTRLADYFEELEMGWTAWSWSDHPPLQKEGRLTAFGRIVFDRLPRSEDPAPPARQVPDSLRGT